MINQSAARAVYDRSSSVIGIRIPDGTSEITTVSGGFRMEMSRCQFGPRLRSQVPGWHAYARDMTTKKSPPNESIGAKSKSATPKRNPLIGRFDTETEEQRITRIYTMTPREASEIIRMSGILTPSGRLKRGYR